MSAQNVHIENEGFVSLRHDTTLLDECLRAGIPMVHACGAKARCSTCRVVLLHGELPPRNELEQKLAEKLNWSDDIRLSCQLRAEHAGRVTVRRVVKDQLDRELLHQSNSARERNVAILFSDIRSFTSFSERHLPHDIVHILNRYFVEMGDAIHQSRGRIDKYMGDGIMAIFGLDGDGHPAKLAYDAARDMLSRLQGFNKYLEATYREHFEIGIGIHYGSVVVGDIGHPKSASFTAIGDAVNIAARIESATKGVAPLLVSESVRDAIGGTGWPSIEMHLKGKSKPMVLHIPPPVDASSG